jgi:hydrogenase nickel incorporation protein HypA/HybF
VHEASIVQDLLERVGALARQHGASGVHRVSVRLGALSGVEPGLLAGAYEVLRAGTACARARLDIEPVDARWECGSCGNELAAGAALRCRSCGGAGRLAQGDEILLERVEMEVP